MDIEEILSSPYFDKVLQFRLSLNNETDRGCALMSAAFLDIALDDLLRSFFVNDPTTIKRVMDTQGPAGTFSSRIDLCFLLGLIGPKAQRDLHMIRKIRNDFAHVPEVISFETQPIKSRCLELYFDPTDETRPRQKFMRVVLGVLSQIYARTQLNKNIEARDDKVITEDIKKLVADNVRMVFKGKDGESVS